MVDRSRNRRAAEGLKPQNRNTICALGMGQAPHEQHATTRPLSRQGTGSGNPGRQSQRRPCPVESGIYRRLLSRTRLPANDQQGGWAVALICRIFARRWDAMMPHAGQARTTTEQGRAGDVGFPAARQVDQGNCRQRAGRLRRQDSTPEKITACARCRTGQTAEAGNQVKTLVLLNLAAWIADDRRIAGKGSPGSEWNSFSMQIERRLGSFIRWRFAASSHSNRPGLPQPGK
jgi:hypothetical protein